MKNILSGLFALAAVAAISLSACSGSAKGGNEQTAAIATTPEAAAALADDGVVEIPAGTENLDQYKGNLTVIDFNAVWCGPCRQYAPTYHAVAEKLSDKAAFLSVNVDSCPSIAQTYVGQFIPQTTVITPDGRVFSKAGQLEEATLVAFIDSVAAL